MLHTSPVRRAGMVAIAVGLLAGGPSAAALAIEPAPEDLPQDPRVDVTEQVVDLTFPVADPDDQVSFIDDFLYLRGGGSRLHAATDVMAPKHRPIHAAVGGVVSFAPYPEPSYGWMISIRGDDGNKYSYIHLNNDTPERDANGNWLDDDAGGVEHAYAPKIADAVRAKGGSLHRSDGIRVERGELIGWNGDSGNAKGVAPHLHLEIEKQDEDGPYRINPYHSLKAALDRGDVPGDTPVEFDGRFRDVDPDGTHGAAIDRLADDGVLTGCDDDRYCPRDAVTRGDLAGYVASVRGLSTTATAEPRFTDVDSDDPNAGAIAAVDADGILTGYEDDTFGPDRPLTRAQLASVLVRAFEVPDASRSAGFSDVPDGGVHSDAIDATAEAGLTRGCEDGSRYCGARDVTREQIASFLDRGREFGNR